jgi:hypothetical protein
MALTCIMMSFDQTIYGDHNATIVTDVVRLESRLLIPVTDRLNIILYIHPNLWPCHAGMFQVTSNPGFLQLSKHLFIHASGRSGGTNHAVLFRLLQKLYDDWISAHWRITHPGPILPGLPLSQHLPFCTRTLLFVLP